MTKTERAMWLLLAGVVIALGVIVALSVWKLRNL